MFLGRMIPSRCIVALIAAGASGVPAMAQQAPAPSVPPAEAASGAADRSAAVAVDRSDSPPTGSASGETVVLSPFEVQDSNTGYYQGSSMSATRFNSKLEDLGASITVVTKQQMQDFAMLDINDIFLYTGNTAGTGTFTDYTVDRNGSVSDNVQGNPQGANRVRGISAANISFGNFETMNRNPIDPSAIDGVEVSRGPNANVFGLGNTGGTVNMVPSAAILGRDFTRVASRYDSYSGYREGLELNRTIIRGKLAVRGSAIFQHDGYTRKPSGQNEVRYNGMVTYRPFNHTTIRGMVGWWRQDGTRPNFTPPRDSISYWVASGKPTWDPVTMTIHVGGQTLGPYTTATYAGPDYFTSTFTGSTHNFAFVDQNGLGYWSAPTTFSNVAGPTSGGQVDRYMSPSPGAGTALGKFVAQPLFSTTPSVSSKALYNYSDINLASINYDMDSMLTSTATIDQVIFTTPAQLLDVQASVFREQSHRFRSDPVGLANDNGQSGQLLIDVNERNLDGSANPYFLRPYIGTDQPRSSSQPATWTTYRAQAAYKLDFGEQFKDSPILKWFGRHEISGYDEYKYRINRQYSFRDAITDAHSWIPAGQSRGNQGAISGGPAAALNITRTYFRYYVGDTNGNNVDYAPSHFAYGTYPFVWGNSATGVFNHEPSTLGRVAVTDATGAGSNTKVILKTVGLIDQSHWFNETLVTTLGVRDDRNLTRFGATPQGLQPDGETFIYPSINDWAGGNWRVNSGRTTQVGAVLRPFLNLPAARSVSGPLGEAVRSLSVFYNKSDNFIPQPPAQDILGRPLANTTGAGEDYGLQFNAFSNRLVIRFNHYIDRQFNARGGDASTLSTRVTRLDLQVSSDAFSLATQARNWITAANPTFTPTQVADEVAKQIGLSTVQQAALLTPNPPLAATQDILAKGNELEINFNPTRYWTVSANAAQTNTVNSHVSTALSTWIAQRMPIWTTIVDQSSNTNWWTTNYGGSQTAAQNFATFIQAPYDLIQQQDGKSNPQNPEYSAKVVSSYQLAGIFEQNSFLKHLSVVGAVRWQGRAAIGYHGLQQLPAVITQYDANHPVYDSQHYYFDGGLSYRVRLFADKINTTFQLNVRNIQDNSHLQAIGAYPDGTPNTYRIVDPREFIFEARFEL
jgi:outer membrane receptor protein involved in Fe transport